MDIIFIPLDIWGFSAPAFWGLVFAGALFGVITAIMIAAFKSGKKRDELLAQEVSAAAEELDGQVEWADVPATVTEKKAEMNQQGKYGHELKFTVTFLTDKGETVTHEVPEAVYAKIKQGESGLLITVNGNFFDFGEGEEV